MGAGKPGGKLPKNQYRWLYMDTLFGMHTGHLTMEDHETETEEPGCIQAVFSLSLSGRLVDLTIVSGGLIGALLGFAGQSVWSSRVRSAELLMFSAGSYDVRISSYSAHFTCYCRFLYLKR